jgi:hypothetical protein
MMIKHEIWGYPNFSQTHVLSRKEQLAVPRPPFSMIYHQEVFVQPSTAFAAVYVGPKKNTLPYGPQQGTNN